MTPWPNINKREPLSKTEQIGMQTDKNKRGPGHIVMSTDAAGQLLLNGYYVRLPSFAQGVGKAFV